MHNRSKDHCSHKYDVYRLVKGSPHSHGTPVDAVPTTAGITSTLNPLPRYYREFQFRSCGNTADTAVIPLPCHFLCGRPPQYAPPSGSGELKSYLPRSVIPVWWPWPLTFWPWNWCATSPVGGTDKLPPNF